MSGSVSSQGTTLTIKVGAAAAIPVLGFQDFSGIGGGSTTVIDTSDLSSVAKEKAAGLPDEGQVKLSFKYLPLDPGQIALEAARSAAAVAEYVITLSNGTKFDFNGFVLMTDKSAGVDQIAKMSASVEITGVVTKTNPA